MKVLKTLEQFNAERRAYYERVEEQRQKIRRNGIACPACGTELYDDAPNMLLSSNPPQKTMRCDKCKWTGNRIA